MLVQLFAEVKDTLDEDLKTATSIAKLLNTNVSFYFDRVEYYINAGGAVSIRTKTVEPKKQ